MSRRSILGVTTKIDKLKASLWCCPHTSRKLRIFADVACASNARAVLRAGFGKALILLTQFQDNRVFLDHMRGSA